MKINKHIEIISSTNKALSSMGEKSRLAILEVLRSKYTEVNITIVNDLQDLQALVAKKPDLVFVGMKYIPSNPVLGVNDPNKIWINDYLEDAGILYTGSSHHAHALEANKDMAKLRVQNAGLNTSPFHIIHQNQKLNESEMKLNFPLFVKPSNRGGGLGIDSFSIVHGFKELHSKVSWISNKLKTDALIEEFLPGREFSVAILKRANKNGFRVMPIELIAEANDRGERLIGKETKSSNTEVVVAVSDKLVRKMVNQLALGVFNALGAQDYGRIDIRLSSDGTPQFLEANLIPSLINGYGSFPKACDLNLGLDHKSMILRITSLAFARDTQPEDAYSSSPLLLPAFAS